MTLFVWQQSSDVINNGNINNIVINNGNINNIVINNGNINNISIIVTQSWKNGLSGLKV